MLVKSNTLFRSRFKADWVASMEPRIFFRNWDFWNWDWEALIQTSSRQSLAVASNQILTFPSQSLIAFALVGLFGGTYYVRSHSHSLLCVGVCVLSPLHVKPFFFHIWP